MSEIINWTAVKTAAEIAARTVSVREVTEAHLAQIARLEPDLGAVVEPLDALALDRADALDRAPSDAVLHGVPVTIKVNVDMAGLANTNGLPALKGNIAKQNAPVVENFLAAGAVPIGRTNTPEFSLRWFTSNPLYGLTRNPVAPKHTPGGSSGGAAAAVAAGMGAIGHGNDLGGSLRYPAYCCGLATLRPSLGKVPAFNPSVTEERPAMLQMMSVQGAIARTFGDVHLSLGALARKSPADPLWSNARTSGRMRGPVLRVGVAADPFGEKVAEGVLRALEIAGKALEDQGVEVVEVTPPHGLEITEIWGRLLNTETDVMAREAMNTVGSAEVLRLLDGYVDFFGVNDLKAMLQDQARRLTIQRAWALMFEDIDVLMMPVSGAMPFLLDQDFRAPETLPDIIRAQRHLMPANVLGLPATSVPTGLIDGVPSGVQIIAPWRDDELAIDVSEMIERALALPNLPVAT